MLVSMKEMLQKAREGKYAVGLFNAVNVEMARAIIETAEELNAPVIVGTAEVLLPAMNLERVAEYLVPMAKKAKVPVCVHYDHGLTFEKCMEALQLGFSSVMYDGSVLPFEENARNTAAVTEYAHKKGITVEAELGHVGNASVGSISETGTDTDPGESLTVPEEVAKFVEITDVDALAVAIGTSHGVYQKTPELRIDRLDEITAICDRPLVLHGGSGTPDEQMQNAIHHGITKINIYSDVLYALNQGLKNTLNNITNPSTWPFLVYEDAMKMMKDVVREKLRTFGSAGRI